MVTNIFEYSFVKEKGYLSHTVPFSHLIFYVRLCVLLSSDLRFSLLKIMYLLFYVRFSVLQSSYKRWSVFPSFPHICYFMQACIVFVLFCWLVWVLCTYVCILAPGPSMFSPAHRAQCRIQAFLQNWRWQLNMEIDWLGSSQFLPADRTRPVHDCLDHATQNPPQEQSGITQARWHQATGAKVWDMHKQTERGITAKPPVEDSGCSLRDEVGKSNVIEPKWSFWFDGIGPIGIEYNLQ